MANHVIDPAFFYDAVEEFAFNYTIFYKGKGDELDDYGRPVPQYTKSTIRGSFQTEGNSVSRKFEGNTQDEEVGFYCMSNSRIHINDIIERYGNYYIVNSIHNYDEWGVREATLSVMTLQENRDFQEWLQYQTGGKIV